MHKKMECPICKKKVLFVGVRDYEGNFHGLVGCEYENDPWSGLSYALHHDGWGDCPLCTDGAYSTMGGMLFDTAEDAISALTPPNEWVSVEERLPENSECWETYIVTVNRSHWPTSSYELCDAPYDEELVLSAQYDSKQKIWHLPWGVQLNALIQADDAPINGDFVTHWMPLPKSPKEDE